MSSALSIRNKCTKTTSNITTCSTAHFVVSFFWRSESQAGGDSNKRIEVRSDKRYFHPKYVVRIKRHEVEQMRNLCFLLYLSLCYVLRCCCLNIISRTSRNFYLFFMLLSVITAKKYFQTKLPGSQDEEKRFSKVTISNFFPHTHRDDMTK